MAQHIGLARGTLHGTSTLWGYQPIPWQGKKAPFPQHGAGPPQLPWFGAPVGLWGGCSPSQPLLAVQWVLQLDSSARKWGDPFAPTGAPLESQELPAAGRSRVWLESLCTDSDGFQMAHGRTGLTTALFRQQGCKKVWSKGNICQKAGGGTRRRRMRRRRRRKRRGMVLFPWLP